MSHNQGLTDLALITKLCSFQSDLKCFKSAGRVPAWWTEKPPFSRVSYQASSSHQTQGAISDWRDCGLIAMQSGPYFTCYCVSPVVHTFSWEREKERERPVYMMLCLREKCAGRSMFLTCSYSECDMGMGGREVNACITQLHLSLHPSHSILFSLSL